MFGVGFEVFHEFFQLALALGCHDVCLMVVMLKRTGSAVGCVWDVGEVRVVEA